MTGTRNNVRRLPDPDDRPATVRDVRRLITDALNTLAGEQREREQRHLDQACAQIAASAVAAVRGQIVDVVDRAAPRALSIPQVAEKLSVSVATVRHMIDHDELPTVRVTAKRQLISLAALDAWLAGRS